MKAVALATVCASETQSVRSPLPQTMWRGKHFILLAVMPILVTCQQKPTVSMFPALRQVFTGDRIYLHCVGGSDASVKWYFNDQGQTSTSKTWRIPVAKPQDSGSYQCEANGKKSDQLTIDVQEFLPIASLTLKTGHPVMATNTSIMLKLENEDGLQGWRCFVFRGAKDNQIGLRLQGGNDKTLEFQPRELSVRESIFWCADASKERRSNQVTVRTSDKPVALEISPLPAALGENVVLTCLAWNTQLVSYVVFYQGDQVIAEGHKTTFEIANVTDSTEGRYKCHATFTYLAHTKGPPYRETSDAQDVLAASPAAAAVLSTDMSCSCPLCPSNASYQYYMLTNRAWERLGSDPTPKQGEVFRCQAVWANRRSAPSRSVSPAPGASQTAIVLTVVAAVAVALGIFSLALCCVMYKRRSPAGAVYEDLPLRGHYETMIKAREKDEYETLHSAAGPSKGGEYEALKAEGKKDDVYHTLSAEGASGGGGGQEASGKDGRPGPEAGGGYEELKRQGMKEGIYHTLSTETSGASGGGAGLQALEE